VLKVSESSDLLTSDFISSNVDMMKIGQESGLLGRHKGSMNYFLWKRRQGSLISAFRALILFPFDAVAISVFYSFLSAPGYLLPHQAVPGEPCPIIGPTMGD
jgi:hypothetical protein